MKPTERDELLIRVDERTKNTLDLVEKQEKHLRQLNDKVAENATNIAVNKSKIGSLEEYGIPAKISISKKQAAVGGGGLATLIVLVLVELGNSAGWW